MEQPPLPRYEVAVQTIDVYEFSFVCPFCYTQYKQNGDPYKKAARKKHHHGSEGNTANRTVDRASQCDPGRFPRDQYSGFSCVIDDDTVRK
jgi:hypothetical protein